MEPLCAGDSLCRRFIVQSNMSNPEEHCNIGFNNLCVAEGGVLRYQIVLGQQPPGPVALIITSPNIQYPVHLMFTPDNWSDDHDIIIVFKENIEVEGNLWTKLNHTFSASGDTSHWWTSRENLLKSVTETVPVDWSAAKLLCEDTGLAFSTSVPVLLTDNDADVIYSIIMATGYNSIEDMEVFIAGFQHDMADALSVTANRVSVFKVRPAGGIRRLQTSVVSPMGHRELAEGNYVEIIFYFLEASPGTPNPSQLWTTLMRLFEKKVLLEAQGFGSTVSIKEILGGSLLLEVETILKSDEPIARGQFVMDPSFLGTADSSTFFFSEEEPDALFRIGGQADGTYIFRPCVHTPPGMAPGSIVWNPGTECQCALESCTATCMWNEV
jgi:hypothetical protein